MFIDSHAHLYLEQFKDDIDSVISSALENKVQKLFLPNIDSTTTNAMFSLCEKYPDICYPMMGLHPCSVKQNYKEELNHISTIKASKKIYGIGETGIDLYWDKTTRDIQIEAFNQQIQWAIDWKLPIIIHSRDAQDLTIELIENMKHPDLRGIFHCFTGTIEQSEKIKDLNFLMGIGGVATFKNGGMNKTLPDIDVNYLVLETDSPYLSPTPYRGKRNESSYIPLIADKVAEYKNMSKEEVMKVTTKNALTLFALNN